jgi:hypothetical protein
MTRRGKGIEVGDEKRAKDNKKGAWSELSTTIVDPCFFT